MHKQIVLRERFERLLRKFDCRKPKRDARQFFEMTPPTISCGGSVQVAPVGPNTDLNDNRNSEFVDPFHFFSN